MPVTVGQEEPEWSSGLQNTPVISALKKKKKNLLPAPTPNMWSKCNFCSRGVVSLGKKKSSPAPSRLESFF